MPVTKQTDDAEPSPKTGDDLLAAVSMARDVQWAWEHMGRSRMSRKEAGSDARFALWKHSRDDRANFVGQVAPKAMGIIDKWAESQSDDAVVKAEKKGIAELKSILAAAIQEASGITA